MISILSLLAISVRDLKHVGIENKEKEKDMITKDKNNVLIGLIFKTHILPSSPIRAVRRICLFIVGLHKMVNKRFQGSWICTIKDRKNYINLFHTVKVVKPTILEPHNRW